MKTDNYLFKPKDPQVGQRFEYVSKSKNARVTRLNGRIYRLVEHNNLYQLIHVRNGSKQSVWRGRDPTIEGAMELSDANPDAYFKLITE